MQLWAQWAARTRTILRRLPKNLRSNRWWVVWNGRVFFRGQPPLPSQEGTHSQSKSELAQPEAWRSYHSPFQIRTRHPMSDRSGHAILIPELGMFGNMTRRIVAAVAVARILGISNVIAPKETEFSPDIYRRGLHELDGGLRLWLWSESRKGDLDALHQRDLISGVRFDAEAFAPELRRAWTDVFDLLLKKPALGTMPQNHLVIHLRGGDVFGPRQPRSYGQPPLSFYEKILDREPWAAVTVIHQDGANPVLAALLDSCAKRKIGCATHSGAVQDDVAVLLRASTLVAGRGTFMPAVVGLSRNVRRVFYFHDKFSLHPPVAGVEIVRIIDKEGTYVRDVLSNNWENSEYQRSLMLSYPQSNLEFSTVD